MGSQNTMTLLYFAYGSNLWPPRLRSRCPSARVRGRGFIAGWTPVYDKPGADGTAKLNIRRETRVETHGAVYEIDEEERTALDLAEPGYTPFTVEVTMSDTTVVEALTYRWAREGTDALPADWYVALAKRGAAHHGLPGEYISRWLHPEVTRT